jgi:hypothetical protein
MYTQIRPRGATAFCRRLFLTAFAASMCFLTPLPAWQSSKVVTVNGQLTYPEDGEGNRIPDFSNAGYRGGDVEIPNITRIAATIPAGSSLAQINSIITSANVSASNPGVVLMEAGTYSISGTINVNKPGLVLRGAGDGRSGGPVTLIRQTNTSTSDDFSTIHFSGTGDENFGSEVSGSRSEITTSWVKVGARSFNVANSGLYSVGDNVVIEHPSNAAWKDAVDPEGWWDTVNFGTDRYIRYHRYITAISGNTITVDAPVFNHLKRSLSVSYLYKYNRSGTLKECALESISVEAAAGNKYAVIFSRVENCWIQNSSVRNFQRGGFLINRASTRCTVYNCRSVDPTGTEIGNNWYNFHVERGQLILFDSCYTSKSRHAFIANGNGLDSGVVVLNSTMNDPRTSAEMHKYWGQGMLFDNCMTTNRGTDDVIRFYNRGGSGDNHGWSAAHCVIWASNAGGGAFTVMKPVQAQNYAIGSLNASVNGQGINGGTGPKGYEEGTGQPGLEPASLYLAQLAERLGDSGTPGGSIALEAEALTYSATGANPTIWSDSNTSGGQWVELTADGIGDYIEYTLPNVPAGTYEVRMSYKGNDNRGILNLRVDGTLVGGTLDQYSASATYPEYSFGTVTLTGTANRIIRLTVTGKNTASAGFVLSTDRFRLVPSVVQTAAPVFTPAPGTYSGSVNVSIASANSGATIRYTTDGSTPTSSTGTIYSAPVTLTVNATIRAIAYQSGMTDSSVTSGSYVITDPNAPIVLEAEALTYSGTGATPTLWSDANTSGGQWIELTADGVGDYIEYTVPNVPAGTYEVRMSYKGNPNRGILNLRVDGTLVGGSLDQYSSSATYPEHSFGTVTLTGTGNRIIRLTVIGRNTASNGYVLSSDLFRLVPTIPQVAAPELSLAGGSYTGPQNVTITTSTSGATIRYTTDGSTPTATTGTVYTGPVAINSSTTLRAAAFKSGSADSTVTSATYTINLTLTAYPTSDGDAYLEGTTRFNDAYVKVGPPDRVSYLKFNVSGVTGTVTSVKLRLTCNGDSGYGTLQVQKGSSNTWTESNLSSTNRPTSAGNVGSLSRTSSAPFALGSTYEIPLTGMLSADGTYTVILTMTGSSVNDAWFHSDEGTANAALKPALIITYN